MFQVCLTLACGVPVKDFQFVQVSQLPPELVEDLWRSIFAQCCVSDVMTICRRVCSLFKALADERKGQIFILHLKPQSWIGDKFEVDDFS